MKIACLFLILLVAGCSARFYDLTFKNPNKVTWLNPGESLDSISLIKNGTTKTNTVTYGFEHDNDTSGHIVWRIK